MIIVPRALWCNDMKIYDDKICRTTFKCQDLESFNKEIKNDMPAVFTYSPHFIYIMPKKIHNVNLGILTNPSERFSNVSKWYIETNHVWGIFVK
jgi:hypothetical protein